MLTLIDIIFIFSLFGHCSQAIDSHLNISSARLIISRVLKWAEFGVRIPAQLVRLDLDAAATRCVIGRVLKRADLSLSLHLELLVKNLYLFRVNKQTLLIFRALKSYMINIDIIFEFFTPPMYHIFDHNPV